MRKGKGSINDAHADSWDDGTPGCSSAKITTRGASQIHHTPSLSRIFLLALCLLACSATVIRAISDPGLPDPEPEPEPQLDADPPPPRQQQPASSRPLTLQKGSYADILHSLRASVHSPPPLDDKSLMPLLYNKDPVSIPRGCHRTSSLIGQSSINPWSSQTLLMAAGSDGSMAHTMSAHTPRIHSELVLCPVSIQGARYKLLSVSGFIALTIPLEESDDDEQQTLHNVVSTGTQDETQQSTASWPQQGQETEGFWRQRNGRPEWEPQSTEPMPLIAPTDMSPSQRNRSDQADTRERSTSHNVDSPPPPAHTPRPDHAEAYDAWSASIGGESAEDWLSFNEWKERHLAELKEKQDAERRAAVEAGKKRNGASKKHHGTQNHTDSANANGTSHNNSNTGAAPETAYVSQNASLGGKQSVHTSATSMAGNASLQSDSRSTPPREASSTAKDSQAVSHDKTRSDHAPPASDSPPSDTQPQIIATDAPDSAPASPPWEGSTPSDPISPDAVPAVRDPASLLKTLRHRWNFASMDCAAVVHRTNPSAKFASSILSEKKDRYMLSPCPDVSGGDARTGNYVVVELCDEISIDTIVLANYEFFSRMYKRFRISVAQSLAASGSPSPRGGAAEKADADDGWYELGTFRARNLRGVQVFNASLPAHSKAPTRFFRYVKIDFLEYYGNEYYCPLSLLRVYGLTQMDDYRREEEEERKAAALAAAAANNYLAIGDGESEEGDDGDDASEEQDAVHTNEAHQVYTASTVAPVDDMWDAVWRQKAQMTVVANANAHTPMYGSEAGWNDGSAVNTVIAADPKVESTTAVEPRVDASPPGVTFSATATTRAAADQRDDKPTSASINGPVDTGTASSTAAYANTSLALSEPTEATASAVCASAEEEQADNVLLSGGTAAPTETCASVSSSGSVSESSTTSVMPPPVAASSSTHASSSSQAYPPYEQGRGGYANNYVPPSSNAGAGSGNANANTGSESIYRTITKRLNALEANATLSLQYIEHSGQTLREVFRAMERRQEMRLGEMLRALNSSNWRQIEALKRRQQVDLQRAIFEFDVHRQQTEAERRALLAEVHVLATEVMFERRLGIVQLLLVLGLFGFMALTRGPTASPTTATLLAKLAGTPRSGSLRGVGQLQKDGGDDGEDVPEGPTPTTTTARSTAVKHPIRSASAITSRDGAMTVERPVRLPTLRTRTSFRRRGSTSASGASTNARPSPRLQTNAALVPETSEEYVQSPSSDTSPPQETLTSSNSVPELPTYDIAEMSESELRNYLGFESPDVDGGDGEFHTTDDQLVRRTLGTDASPRWGYSEDEDEDEEDEGAETAIEELEGESAAGVGDAVGEDEQTPSPLLRAKHLLLVTPRRAASAEPSLSMQRDDSGDEEAVRGGELKCSTPFAAPRTYDGAQGRGYEGDSSAGDASTGDTSPPGAPRPRASGMSTPNASRTHDGSLSLSPSPSIRATAAARRSLSPGIQMSAHTHTNGYDRDDDEEGDEAEDNNPWQRVLSRRKAYTSSRPHSSGSHTPPSRNTRSPPVVGAPNTAPRPQSPFLMYSNATQTPPERRHSSLHAQSAYPASPTPSQRRQSLLGTTAVRPASPLGPARVNSGGGASAHASRAAAFKAAAAATAAAAGGPTGEDS